MNSEDISSAINEIDDEIIESANEMRKPKTRKSLWFKFAASAAVIGIVAFAGINAFTINEPPVEGSNDFPLNSGEEIPEISDGSEQPYGGSEELPLIVFEEAAGIAYGWEAYIAHDVSELDSGNPWNESMVFETLPVFENIFYHETGMALPGIGEEAMLEKINFSAEALDAEIQEICIRTLGESVSGIDMPDDTVTITYAYTENCCIDVSSSGEIVAHFGNEEGVYREGIELPSAYNFTYSETSDGEAFEAISYIYHNYSDFIGTEEPTFVSWADYTFDGNQNRDYRIYDFSGDALNDMLNYSFSSVSVAPNDEGKLMLIRISDKLSCADKIGDYPIISPEEAKELLLSGSYITTVPYEIPGEEYISKTELMYRSGNAEKIWMPYYRFLVEIPGSLENTKAGDLGDLKEFAAYYVPAVKMEYISGLPLWNGSFN